MNDYISRGEITPVDRSVTRAPSSLSAVQPVASATSPQAGSGDGGNGSAAEDSRAARRGMGEGSIASSAEYARVHARIADILASLHGQTGATSVEGAAAEIQSMIPQPQVMVPLPPASKEAVESAIRIAKRIAEQGAHAQVAQANVPRALADQIVTALPQGNLAQSSLSPNNVGGQIYAG
jgi:hypothetical protein